MRINLNLAQATAVLDTLELMPVKAVNPGLPGLEEGPIGQVAALKEATIVLKTAVQEELQSTQIRFDSIVKELEDHGYTEVTEELTTVRLKIEAQGTKTHDKYFDENGQIKPKKL